MLDTTFRMATNDALTLAQKKAFAANIVKWRHGLGLSQDEMASRLGVKAEALKKWEQGKSFPHRSSLAKIATFYGRPIAELTMTNPPDRDLPPTGDPEVIGTEEEIKVLKRVLEDLDRYPKVRAAVNALSGILVDKPR